MLRSRKRTEGHIPGLIALEDMIDHLAHCIAARIQEIDTELQQPGSLCP